MEEEAEVEVINRITDRDKKLGLNRTSRKSAFPTEVAKTGLLVEAMAEAAEAATRMTITTKVVMALERKIKSLNNRDLNTINRRNRGKTMIRVVRRKASGLTFRKSLKPLMKSAKMASRNKTEMRGRRSMAPSWAPKLEVPSVQPPPIKAKRTKVAMAMTKDPRRHRRIYFPTSRPIITDVCT